MHLHTLQVLACRTSTFGPRSFAACATVELFAIVTLRSNTYIHHSVAGQRHIFLVWPTGAHS